MNLYVFFFILRARRKYSKSMKETKPIIGITTDIKEGNYEIEEKYAIAIANAGGIPVLIPSIPDDSELIVETVARIDGLLLPGSRDMDPKYYNEEPHPKLRPMSLERTKMEFAVLEETLNRELPVVGICGGMQLLNVFYGGTLYQDIYAFLPDSIPHEKGAQHEVTISKDSRLYKIVGADKVGVKSYHHQSVKDIGEGLIQNAQTEDEIVEGIESTDNSYVLGIQWHPELEDGEVSSRIFKSFIDQCRENSE